LESYLFVQKGFLGAFDQNNAVTLLSEEVRNS